MNLADEQSKVKMFASDDHLHRGVRCNGKITISKVILTRGKELSRHTEFTDQLFFPAVFGNPCQGM